MAAASARRDIGTVRSGHNGPDQPVAPLRSSRKRHLTAKDEEEDPADHRRKSRRIQENLNRRPKNTPKEGQKPVRQSLRLQERRATNSQRIAKGGKEETIVPHPQRKGLKQQQCRKEKDEHLFTEPPARSGVHKSTRHRHSESNGDESHRQAKHSRPSVAQYSGNSNKPPGKDEFIEYWLGQSSWLRNAPTEHQTGPFETVIEMPRKAAAVLPSPDNSSESATSVSRKSEKSTASVHDTDYHQSLRYRNIFIEREDPPPELVRRAIRIISRSRTSPEIDDTTIQKLKDKARRLRNEAEDVIIKQLGPHIIPAINELPDQRLEINADQPWFDSVPIPLDTSILANPLPLPKPRPDITFGYSEAAFTRNQLGTIDLLIDDKFERSFVVPDQKIRFPFLQIEFKSQAKNGTHYIATNQAAGGGAIALNGNLDLIQRSFGIENFDYNEPQYFSVTMDHELARINVHWLRAPAKEGGQHSFHVEGLSKHLLDDSNGIRALSRAIKNILDNAADVQLRRLCEALDAYRDIVVRNRAEAANPQWKDESKVLHEQQTIQRTKGTAQPLNPRMDGDAPCGNEGINKPLLESKEVIQPGQRPRRAQTTGQREVRSRVHVPTKAGRTSSKRTSRALQYD